MTRAPRRHRSSAKSFRLVALFALIGLILQVAGGFGIIEVQAEESHASSGCCGEASEENAPDADDECPCPLDCDKGCVGMKTLAVETPFSMPPERRTVVPEILPELRLSLMIGVDLSEIMHVPKMA